MPPEVFGGVRVAIKWLQHTQERVCVIHGTAENDWDLPSLVALGAELLAVFQGSPWRDSVADDLVLQSITSTSLRGADSEQWTTPCTSNCAGTATAAPAVGSTTATISWRTTGIGRSKRGRSFTPGFLDTQTNDDDTVTSQKVAQLGLLASNLFLAFTLQSAQIGVYSRVLNFIAPVFTWIVENVIDSQRRRLPGRGN